MSRVTRSSKRIAESLNPNEKYNEKYTESLSLSSNKNNIESLSSTESSSERNDKSSSSQRTKRTTKSRKNKRTIKPFTQKVKERTYIFQLEHIDNHPPIDDNIPSPPNPKTTLNFADKSDEDIVYGSGYNFNCDIETLINGSTTNKRSNKKKTPRRQNSWILYRRDKSAAPEFAKQNVGVVSSQIREMWRNESEDVKKIFAALTNLAEKRHREKYGDDYKYEPIRRTRQKKTKRVVKSDKNNQLILDFSSSLNSIEPKDKKNNKDITFIQQFDNDVIKNQTSVPVPELSFHNQIPNSLNYYDLTSKNKEIQETSNELTLFDEYIRYEDCCPESY